MDQVSTHNEADKSKEKAQVSKQSRVISTRNVIPYNRPVTKEDVTEFVKKREAIISGKTDAEIKPAAAKLDDEGRVIHPAAKPGVIFTEEQLAKIKELYDLDDIAGAQKNILDYLSSSKPENKHIGEDFDTYLEKNGILNEVTASAEMQVIDYAAERAKAEAAQNAVITEQQEEPTQAEQPEADKPKRGRKPKDAE